MINTAKIHSNVNDECYTPFDAVVPLIKHLPEWVKIVWCPCDKDSSEIVKALNDSGRRAIATHIDDGFDFLKLAPSDPSSYDMIITNPPYSCYSDDTEVFTKRGWVSIKDIDLKDFVLSLDYTTNKISWDSIIGRVKRTVNEPLINFKNKNMDLLVTKDHRMLAYDRHTNEVALKDDDLIRADEVSSTTKYYMPKKGFKWVGNRQNYLTLPYLKNPLRSTPKEYPDLKIEIHAWLEFFGLWLADGCTRSFRGTGRGYTVSIKQAEDGWNYVKEVLDKLPFKYRIQYDKEEKGLKKKANFDINNRQLWVYLTQFGKARDKFVPTWVKELAPDYLEALMKGYTFGDSSTTSYKGKKAIVYSSVSRQLIEDVQEVLLKLGYLTQVSENTSKTGKYWSIVFNKESYGNRAMYVQKAKCPDVAYKGFVYCLTLKKNSVFLVRRNNKTMFCGNCKDKMIERCIQLGKPWALLLPLDALCGKKRAALYEQSNGVGVITLKDRLNFTGGHGNWFYNAWVCSWPEINGKWIQE